MLVREVLEKLDLESVIKLGYGRSRKDMSGSFLGQVGDIPYERLKEYWDKPVKGMEVCDQTLFMDLESPASAIQTSCLAIFVDKD